MARHTAPRLNFYKKPLMLGVVLAALLCAAPAFAQEYESDEAQALAEDAAAYAEQYEEQYPDVPGMDQVVNEDGEIDLFPGEEEEEVKKKYVYKKPTADDEFFGTHLPKRVFNNIPPRL